VKQRYEGKRIINWHRPFRPSRDLRKRYLRNRYAEPKVDNEENVGGILDEWSLYCDEEWDILDPAEDIDYAIHEARKLVMQGAGWGQVRSILSESWSLSSFRESRDERSQIPLDAIPSGSRQLEEELAEHLHQLTDARNIEGWLPQSVRDAVQDGQDLDLLHSIALKDEDFASMLLMFAPFWIRRLRNWDFPESQSQNRVVSLVNHLFVYYPVPEFLYAEWLREPANARIKWLCWFILLGQGGSLYRAARHFNWVISRKFPHHLGEVPPQLTPTEACMYAEVRRLGGSQIEFDRLRANPSYVIDPTAVSSRQHYLCFWRNAIVWLIRHRDSITDEDCNLILDWAMHQYTEAQFGGEPFSWQGRSPRRLLEASIEYHRQIADRWSSSSFQWQGHKWDWEWTDEDTDRWSFVELTSGLELFHEGKELHHCVSTYAARCAAGYSAIVSLRYENVRRITIEINPHTRKLVQIRGSYNRPLQAHEQSIIKKWMSNVVLKDPHISRD
jgi:hypothetical protein